MAGILGRSALQKTSQIGTLLGKQLGSGRVAVVQVATLRATYGEPFGYKEPYDYKNRRLTVISEWMDLTLPRFNENTKIILVDGNIAVGKNDFAERLAKAFDLRYYPSVSPERVYVETHNGFDKRKLNDILPESCRFYDLEDFYTDKNPHSGRAGSLGWFWFRKRMQNYMSASLHLLSTGQGVVIATSVFAELAYLDAMLKNDYIKKPWHDFIKQLYTDTVFELLPPHLCIYLSCPTEAVRERINKRNNPIEMNTKVLTDQYLKDIDSGYRDIVLKRLERTSEIVEVDWTEVGDDLDIETIAEELEGLTLENVDHEQTKFRDWKIYREDDVAIHRKRYSDPKWCNLFMQRDQPRFISEVLKDPKDCGEWETFYKNHPAICHPTGWMSYYKSYDDLSIIN